jgi:hypothetical protein
LRTLNIARTGEDRDHKLAQFISSLRPQSLKMIETIRDIGVGPETFLALSSHGESLVDLRLCVSSDSLPSLSLLRGCTGLESLRVEDIHGTTNLEKTQNDVFLETVDWLRKCKKLRNVTFAGLQSASAIVTPLLLEDKIQLRTLDISQYSLKDSQVFNQGLVHQRDSLRYLLIIGETEGCGRDDIDILVDSLKQLAGLRELRLQLIQEVFNDEHLIAIIDELKLLEELYITGLVIEDDVLQSVAGLANLKSVTFSGISKFSYDGLFEFVSNLGQGNQGIRVMIDMADPDTLLSDDEVAFIRKILEDNVGGSLEYTPTRGSLAPRLTIYVEAAPTYVSHRSKHI